MQRHEILERIQVQLYDQAEVDPKLVTEEARLVADLDIDSLDLLELMVYLRKQFGVSVHEGEVKALLTSLARFLPEAAPTTDDDLSREDLVQVTESLRVSTLLDFVETRLTAEATS